MRRSKCQFTVKHFLVILPFFLPFSSFGQKFSVGLRAAPSLNWFGFGDKEVKDNFSRRLKLGYSGGVFISFPMKNNYHLVAEGGYAEKGRKLRYDDDILLHNATYHFIEGSMLLRRAFKFYLRKDVPSDWYVNVGPEVAYWLSGKGNAGGYAYDVVFGDPPESNGNFYQMYIQDANRWLFGVAMGVGFTAPLRYNKRIGVELRFVSGHTFLSKKAGFDPNNYPVLGFDDTVKTNIKLVNLGISYFIDMDVVESRKGKSTLDKKIKRHKPKKKR